MGQCKHCGGDTGKNKEWCCLDCKRAHFAENKIKRKYRQRKPKKPAYIPQKNEQLCWTCKKATTGECSWSAKLIPIDGWDAVPSKVHADGFRVRHCPEYVNDEGEFGVRE